ncbi:MAG: bifunctional phosphoribosylaminoimidazolecarboxamide formyltransferase/IMP cyclohydrolase [Planctomycetota bacterium]|jgi:phosphoribosylaminoimidazolecarboxamide formyltransferase/IMP cyclohydrolase
MSLLVPIRRALISVSDTTGLAALAGTLCRSGAELVCTSGTAKVLAQAGIGARRVEEITGAREMMGGRVKTLHPAIHGAVLARRDVEGDRQALREHGIEPIDLVCVNLYPFEQAIRAEKVVPEAALEQIDIGGPALIRSAAKNHRFVTVVTSPGQYERLGRELEAHGGATSLELRRELAAAAFDRSAEYDALIGAWMASSPHPAFPAVLGLTYARLRELRYGENPHQKAALYIDAASREPSVAAAKLLNGKPLSYNNVHDAAAALELIQDLRGLGSKNACAAIIKHANPCGAAVARTLPAAFDLAHEGDPLAAYGGILATSRRIDVATAERICDGEKFLEVIIGPDYDQPALEMLRQRWKNVRLLAVGDLERRPAGGVSYKSVPGGMLAQERDTAPAEPARWTHAAGPAPKPKMLKAAAVVWTVVKHLKSNAIAIGGEGRLIGAGTGQVDRVSACRLAIAKAGDRITSEAVAASDGFFPFTDGPQLLIDAGLKCIVHPGGSRRDQETIDLCQEQKVTCLLTGVRHFRH